MTWNCEVSLMLPQLRVMFTTGDQRVAREAAACVLDI